MSKTEKIILLVALCMLPVGILLAILGLRFGGKATWGLDLNNMKYYENTNMQEKTVSLDAFDSIVLDVSSADIMIKTGDSYSLTYRTPEDREPEVKQSGSEVRIKQNIDNRLVFTFFSNIEGERFILTVPKDSKEYQLTVDATSGDIVVDKVAVSGRITLSSGDVALRDFDGGRLNLQGTSGDLEVDGVNMNTLYVKTSSGDMSVQNGTIGDLSLAATSGDINLGKVTSDTFTFDLSSGDVDLIDSKISQIRGAVTSGDVDMRLLGNEKDYDYDLSVTSGDIEINGDEKDEHYIRDEGCANKITVSTTSGDIDIRLN
ncbi:MAG: DUF4097 family beta strand repeat protein [Lachnospiraceae bacterium]|nr:DUF4097 family beta strand repeat protein [Lachnospiraceae bacterium]